MKKGLTLVAAMIGVALICLMGTAAAAMTGVNTMTAAATAIVAVVFGSVIVTIGAVAYMRLSAKKGHTGLRFGSLVESLNAVLVHRMTAVNARYAFTKIARATSPQMISRAYGNYFDR